MVKSIFVFVFGVVCERIHLDDGPFERTTVKSGGDDSFWYRSCCSFLAQ